MLALQQNDKLMLDWAYTAMSHVQQLKHNVQYNCVSWLTYAPIKAMSFFISSKILDPHLYCNFWAPYIAINRLELTLWCRCLGLPNTETRNHNLCCCCYPWIIAATPSFLILMMSSCLTDIGKTPFASLKKTRAFILC